MTGERRTSITDSAQVALKPAQAARQRVDLKTSRLAGLLGFNLRLAAIAFYRDFMAVTADLNLTPKQYAVLVLIDEHPGVSQVDIAAALVMDRATMMALVDRLAGRSLIERRPSSMDRRRQDLYVTAAGADALKKARDIIDTHEAAFVEGWPPEDVKQLITLLRRLQKTAPSA